MLAKLKTFSLLGIDALPVEVEVDVSPAGLPKTVLVGLPEAAVKESTHRVERAIVNSGFQRPQDRVVINSSRPAPVYEGRKGSASQRSVHGSFEIIDQIGELFEELSTHVPRIGQVNIKMNILFG